MTRQLPWQHTGRSEFACKLQTGDRVILTEQSKLFEALSDIVFTVASIESGLVWLKSEELPTIATFDEFLECEHDSHCRMCGVGQNDIGSGKPNAKDDLSWCEVCNADICGNCDCGHWDDKWKDDNNYDKEAGL